MRTKIMGIVNATPDSFSDGGQFPSTQAVIEHALELIDQGADIIDVGGESTRPGSSPVSVGEELRRVLPVIEAIAGKVEISVDTLHAEVASQAVAAGAQIVNDVSGGLYDPQMLAVVGQLGVRYVCTHWRKSWGQSTNHNPASSHQDVLAELVAELQQRISDCLSAGIAQENIILDPGIGFAKSPDDDWTILRNLGWVQQNFRFPLLIGASRKKFFGQILPGSAPTDRDFATAAVTSWCCANQVWAVRTHQVRANLDTALVYEQLLASQGISGQLNPANRC